MVLAYSQFLKIREYLNYLDSDSLDDWHEVQETVTRINHFLERLERKNEDWKKMPRSRDFPFNGIEFLKMWKASIIDKIIDQVKVQRDSLFGEE